MIGSPLYAPPEALGGSMVVPLLPRDNEQQQQRNDDADREEMKTNHDGAVMSKSRPEFGHDVFSFGILMYAVTHGNLIVYDKSIVVDEETFVDNIVRKKLRPKFNPMLVSTLERTIMEWCWAEDPKTRPTCKMIVSKLSGEKKRVRHPAHMHMSACT